MGSFSISCVASKMTVDCGDEVLLFPLFPKNHLSQEYIQSMRISEAKSLLEKTQLRVTQIAFEVGFLSLSHFYRVFHKSEKRAPREYRKTFQVV